MALGGDGRESRVLIRTLESFLAQGGDLPDLERRIILASAGTAEELRPNVKAVQAAGLIWATDACLTQKAALSVANIYAGSEAGSIEDQGRKYYDIVLQAYEEAQRNPGGSKELARLARNETGGFGPVATDAGPGDQKAEVSGPLDHLQHTFTERERMRAFRDPYKYLTILDKNEGGYINHPDDKGGETYRGVSRNTWGNWPGWELIDAAKAAGITKPKDIDEHFKGDAIMDKLVDDVYLKEYWEPLADLPLPEDIIFKIFDSSAYAGPPTVRRFLQEVINQMRPTEKLKVDGRLGPKTMEAIKEVVKDEESEKRFKELYTKRLEKLHEDTVRNRPNKEQFLAGWMKRSRTWNHHRLYPEMFGLKKEE